MNGPRMAFIGVGRLKERFYEDAAAEYLKRLSRFVRAQMIEVADEPAPARLSQADVEKIVRREGEKLLARISPGDFVIALCIDGVRHGSEAFAAELEKWMAAPRTVFLIGGSHGLSGAVLSRANARLSLSDMTFPHQLARVMLLEQVYRALKICNHETYHK